MYVATKATTGSRLRSNEIRPTNYLLLPKCNLKSAKRNVRVSLTVLVIIFTAKSFPVPLCLACLTTDDAPLKESKRTFEQSIYFTLKDRKLSLYSAKLGNHMQWVAFQSHRKELDNCSSRTSRPHWCIAWFDSDQPSKFPSCNAIWIIDVAFSGVTEQVFRHVSLRMIRAR